MNSSLHIVTIILQLIFLEGILSIDNAMVLGSLVAHLPDSQIIPWPSSFPDWFRSHFHRLLGHQQQAALRVGLIGAYLGRGLMLFFATYIIRNPWLKLIGALYLLKLAFEHLGEFSQLHLSVKERMEEEVKGAQAETEAIARKAGRGFWSTVLVVELSDLAFSLDNVVAAVAISNNFLVVFAGVAIGIALMRVAAGFFVRLIKKEPVLTEAAYLLIMNIGFELLAEEAFHREIGDLTKFAVSLLTVFLVVGYQHALRLHFLNPLLYKISQAFYFLSRFWQIRTYQQLLVKSRD